MTILSTIQRVTAVIALNKPAAVFSSTDREMFELQVLANTCGDYIAKDYEWRVLKALATITGDGSAETFALPADYDRMLKVTKLWSDRFISPLTHITSTDRWLELDIRQFDLVVGAWTMIGTEINIKPAPATGELVKYYYMSSKWATDIASTTQNAFDADNDTFRLSERLLELCMIWQWRANKGLPYAQDQDNYEDAKEKLIVTDKGSNIIATGPARRMRGVSQAYPANIVP